AIALVAQDPQTTDECEALTVANRQIVVRTGHVSEDANAAQMACALAERLAGVGVVAADIAEHSDGGQSGSSREDAADHAVAGGRSIRVRALQDAVGVVASHVQEEGGSHGILSC